MNLITFKDRHNLLSFLIALILGMFILFYTSLLMRWTVGFSSVLLIFFIGYSVKNAKNFYLVLFALALPIDVINFIGSKSSTHLGGPAGFYNTFLDFPLLMLYILWIPKILISKTAKIRFSKMDFCFMGIIAMCFLSIFNAVDIKLCFYSIVQLIKMYLIYFYFANAIKTKHEFKLIIIFLLAGVVLEGLLGFFQFVCNDTFGLNLLGGRPEMKMFGSLSRVSGTLGHPNNLSRYLVLFIPLSISLFYMPPLRLNRRLICCAIFLLSFSTLILTLSRAGWGAFIVSVFFLLVVGLSTRLFSLNRTIIILITFLILFSVLIFSFQNLIFTRLFSDDYGSAFSRIPQFKVALNIIKAHPFLGVGINNYTEVMHLYDNTPEGITSLIAWGVHNSYLLVACEIGIIGLCFFLYFISLLFAKGVKVIRTTDKFVSYSILGIIAGILAFLITIMIDPMDLVRANFICFWMLAGLISALNRLVANGVIS